MSTGRGANFQQEQTIITRTKCYNASGDNGEFLNK